MADPILRWAGGKRQIIDDIVTRLPPERDYNDYYEPFFGGGAVFFELEPDNGYINDINETLMNFYELFKDNIDHIIRENKKIDDDLNRYNTLDEKKEFYYTRRREFNELQNGCCEDELREAVLFLFLNRTCFNGLYRTNEKGDFNVPMKKKVIMTESIEDNLKKGHKVLQSAKIHSRDFKYIRDEVQGGDLVFLDPPYINNSDARYFDQYSPGGFDRDQQVKLRDIALELHHRGAYVMITNSAQAEDLYRSDDNFMEHFRIKPVEAARSINSDSSQRSQIGTTDIIVTNSPQFWEQRNFDDYR
ncbi:DNA adenine methylase [Natrarchaeobaculum aegyptiacum]|uniref:site-specific DNA-methyltransferase (adenine-specific) n=1 Tax=Natrarchaeobaculum aegyptiacum TaxID=745377 RepID=A0A2Z2HS60_9EURY|nr:Dam family site-specific DNA-(adenine-N6)-methyltransferase [Natrarchaeobaculum aegyptiacum]ARS89932.1 hypothetical protein B1756_09460 [Natrarchaeobaculum aegyptiacum]